MESQTVRVVDALLDVRTGGAEGIWTYRAEPDITPGDALMVPLASRAVIAYALRIYEADEATLGFPLKSLRRVLNRIEGLGLPNEMIELVKFVSEEYLCPLPVALGAASPPGAAARISSSWELVDTDTEHQLSTAQQEVLATLKDAGGVIVEVKAKPLPQSSLKALRLLEGKGLVRHVRRATPHAVAKADQGMLKLSPDSDRIEGFLMKEGKRKPAQALTIMRLQTAEEQALTRDEIRALCGVTDQTIRALMSAGYLVSTELSAAVKRTPPEPNPHQKVAIEAISDAVQGRRPESFLLYGVTGSGKTEVFLRAASEALKAGRQVLYLVPEIALATQAIAQLRERFGDRVAVLHSELAAGKRLDHWLRIRAGDMPVVLGARSAIFAPIANLGLIIMDEEHESTYKQDTSPRYLTKTLALKLGELHGCPVVLGSATPSIETFFEAQSGKHHLLTLPNRTASAKLPEVIVDDLTLGYRRGEPTIIDQQLATRMRETLERKEQVILFLNRRAYSPFLICRDCGNQFTCPRCSVSLSYSRQQRLLRCHHCDYRERPPETCPKCNGHRLNPMGIGTEKVEEAVVDMFPNYVVARLDRDISKKKGAVEDLLARFRSGEIHILVGTQIVAKGLDFPNVTLVGVITADLSLNIPDFRASERTFQLLSQVAGRAGRGHAPGFVVIQTFNKDHISILAARDHDYEWLYNNVIEERRLVGYPPYRRLVNILISGSDLSQTRQVAAEVASRLVTLPEVEVLGPVDAAIEKLANKWRRHVLVKLPAGASVVAIGEALADLRPKGIVVAIDVDPYSLL